MVWLGAVIRLVVTSSSLSLSGLMSTLFWPPREQDQTSCNYSGFFRNNADKKQVMMKSQRGQNNCPHLFTGHPSLWNNSGAYVFKYDSIYQMDRKRLEKAGHSDVIDLLSFGNATCCDQILPGKS
eukprot:scaffold83170_cov26-Prasinocladus_malaysianus.AAC.1